MYGPGKGWKYLGGSVYELGNTRVHCLGQCRINGEYVDGNRWPESRELRRYIRINGGNRRRGCMAWARQLTAR